MPLTHIAGPAGVAPGNGYSHVVFGTGRLVAVAGQIALDEHGALVGRADAGAQARQVFVNLRRCLAEAGATFDDVVKLTYYVIDVAHLPAIREARDEVINVSRPPASTAVQVAALFAPEFLLEIEALAIVAEPVAAEPVAPEPVAAEPVAAEPVTADLPVAELVTVDLDAAESPVVALPGAGSVGADLR